jgi:hypothetical protein
MNSSRILQELHEKLYSESKLSIRCPFPGCTHAPYPFESGCGRRRTYGKTSGSAVFALRCALNSYPVLLVCCIVHPGIVQGTREKSVICQAGEITAKKVVHLHYPSLEQSWKSEKVPPARYSVSFAARPGPNWRALPADTGAEGPAGPLSSVEKEVIRGRCLRKMSLAMK